MISVEVTKLVRDEGSIIVFRGQELEENGVDYVGSVTFAVEHRCAQALADYLAHPELKVMDRGVVEIEEWQVISRVGDPS